ncbi:SGNH hydrolase [Hyaloscypha hepaticicola]|uniref:SGNH hydrolase n=1 Tax=Hyaloscypha hepaticicola TaxID=2082293 RepID=A0A2J6PGX6_9HELO|nr:SGNH hydrolase [Hyaloscypha hepaticicola]
MESKKPLRILCFGDSLTEGYTQHGMDFTPYSDTLLDKLRANLSLSTRYNISIDTDGMSGDQVTGGFLVRMKKRYEYQLTKNLPYNWVIFLGGTNDIGWGKPTEQIHSTIKEVTDIPLENGARVLMLTVPECAVKSASLDERREELNQALWEDERDGVFTLDLFEKMPYHSLTKEERKELWDDGLHFTAAGYAKIGSLVAERLIEIIEEEARSGKE